MVADEDIDFLRRGTRLDRYEIRELIGAGGMGRVYRARDTTLNRDVVIKTLVDKSADFIRRFMREASVMAKLTHQNVVQILDFRVSDAGQPFIVMPFLRGQDLSERLKQGPIEVGDAVDLILGVCAGVFACHRRGIIHRDLKPRNVFLAETVDYGTVVKVLDFGVARLAQSTAVDDLTNAGTVIGTPKYMAPEQVKREAADERTDQYGIGLLLYCASTRRMPFAKLDGIELVRAILKGDYPPPRQHRPEIPDELAEIIGRAMHVERDDRFPSVYDLGRALLPWATPEGKGLWTPHFTTAPRPMVAEASTACIRDPRPESTACMRDPSGTDRAEAETAKTSETVVETPQAGPVADPSIPMGAMDASTTLVPDGNDHAGPDGESAAPVIRASSPQPDLAIDGAVAHSEEEALPGEGSGTAKLWSRHRRLLGLAIVFCLFTGVGGVSWLLVRAATPDPSRMVKPERAALTDAAARSPSVREDAGDGGADAASMEKDSGPAVSSNPSATDQTATTTRASKSAKRPTKASKTKPVPSKASVRYTPDGWPILE